MGSARARQGDPRGAAPAGIRPVPTKKAFFSVSVATGSRKTLVRRGKGVEGTEDKETERCHQGRAGRRKAAFVGHETVGSGWGEGGGGRGALQREPPANGLLEPRDRR